MLEVTKFKKLLGISVEDTSQDFNLEFIIDDVTESILNYCKIEELPSGLTNTAYRMAIDLYRNESIGYEDAPVGSVSSVKEGDTQTSFNKYVDDNFKDTVLKSYYSQLNRYRKLVWR